jgi:hypothetical protein
MNKDSVKQLKNRLCELWNENDELFETNDHSLIQEVIIGLDCLEKDLSQKSSQEFIKES